MKEKMSAISNTPYNANLLTKGVKKLKEFSELLTNLVKEFADIKTRKDELVKNA